MHFPIFQKHLAWMECERFWKRIEESLCILVSSSCLISQLAIFLWAFYIVSNSRATIGNNPGALFEYAERTDLGPYASINVSLGGGILKFGATGIYLTRKEVFGESDPSSEIDLKISDYNKGTATQLIGGARLTLPYKWLPTVAVKYNNLASQDFNAQNNSAGAPEKVKSSLDAGVSLTPKLGRRTRVHFEVNYKDVTSEYTIMSSRRLSGGIEFDMSRKFFVRLGYGDGFGSGGVGVRTKRVRI